MHIHVQLKLDKLQGPPNPWLTVAEAAVFVNKNKLLVMHIHVQLKLGQLRGPPNPWLTVNKVPGHLLPFC
jgi:hypothetical protein